MTTQLEHLARRLENDPFFLACPLKSFADSEGLTEQLLAKELRCAEETLMSVRLCRAPVPEDESFHEDIQRIAATFSLDPDVLAAAVRHGQAIFHMRQGEKSRRALLAARDSESASKEGNDP